VPRIRCAVCPDFDLCLDCFATTDHSAAVSRLKAAATAHKSVQEGPTPGISASAVNHDSSHRYRVADSTRYPLFPSARVISKELQETASNDGMDDDADEPSDENKEDAKQEEKEETKEEAKVDEKKDDSPDVEMKDVDKEGETEKSNDGKGPRAEGNQPTEAKEAPETLAPLPSTVADSEVGFVVQDDPKTVWTVEEDLRLLDAIATCGLGNWADIAEAISGQGSSSKTAKRCMERYFDDFLGRYGHILPAYTIVDDEEEPPTEGNGDDDGGIKEGGESEPKKRRMDRMSSFGVASVTSGRRGKKVKVVPTTSLPGYDEIWPEGYLPPIPDVQTGQEVGRDHRYRAEQVFVKLIANAESKEEVARIRKEWEETRLNQPNGPTALPMRVEDLPSLPGSDLAGFMPRRGDFDMEWENDAENVLADMEFSPHDLPQDRDLKIKVIQIYHAKQDERDRRKQFLLSRGLMDYRKNQQVDAKLPRDERDLVRRMRIFERLHTPAEHNLFINDILKAKRLRKEIARLQMYRRIGIRTLAEAEKYENDKKRREIHKMSFLQKEADGERAAAAKASGIKEDPTAAGLDDDDIRSSLWKQYRTSDRKNRRSINRSAVPAGNALDQVRVELDGAEKPPGDPAAQPATTRAPDAAAAVKPSGDKPAATETPAAPDGLAKDTPMEDVSKEETLTTEPEKVTEKSAEKEEANTLTEEKKGDEPAKEKPEAEKASESPAAEDKKDDAMEVDKPAVAEESKEESKEEGKDESKDEKKEESKEEKKDDEAENNLEEEKSAEVPESNGDSESFPITGMKGFDLLNKKEVELCRKLLMKPALYLKAKKVIIQESFRVGILDRENSLSRTIVTIDVQKRGNVIDFLVKAGWISTKVGAAMKQ
jgi:hypothetical protein